MNLREKRASVGAHLCLIGEGGEGGRYRMEEENVLTEMKPLLYSFYVVIVFILAALNIC